MPNGRHARTEVFPEVVFLGKLVDRIVAGKIRVPRFQRPFVWRQADLHALLDSVLRGFPIGSILVWDTEKHIATTQRIGPVHISSHPGGVVGYLLDGQQRVSTLVGTLRLPDTVSSPVDQVDWRVYCDLETREFVRTPSDGIEPQHFPVRSLLSTAGFFAACRRIQQLVPDERKALRWLNEADRLATAFRDYQLPLIHIREADLDSAVTVFARLNRKGHKMTEDAMVSALTYREGEFHLAEKLDEFKGELYGLGFGNLDRVLLLRAVLAALDRDIYAKDWADLMVKPEVRAKLPQRFDLAAEGIRRALVFLKDLGVTSDRLLPYGLQLVLLGEFFRLCPKPPAETVRLLKRWFWVTSFTGWFGGVSTAQSTRALREIRDLANGTAMDFQVIDLDAPALPFPNRFDGRSARVRAFLLYLASLRPLSLEGTRDLDPGNLLSVLGTRAMGHVLSSPTRVPDLFSSPANRMFVDDQHVGQTFTALADLDDDKLRRIMPGHGFPPESLDLLRNDDRPSLIRARLGTLIAGERDFLRSRHVALPTEQTGETVADSDASDDED